MVLKLVHFGKYLENIEMWRWSRKEISWIDRVKNEAVLHRVKEKKEHPTNNKTKDG